MRQRCYYDTRIDLVASACQCSAAIETGVSGQGPTQNSPLPDKEASIRQRETVSIFSSRSTCLCHDSSLNWRYSVANSSPVEGSRSFPVRVSVPPLTPLAGERRWNSRPTIPMCVRHGQTAALCTLGHRSRHLQLSGLHQSPGSPRRAANAAAARASPYVG